MKKLVIFAVMLLGVATAAFGENEKGDVVNSYDINVHAESLVRYLGTSEDQSANMLEFHRGFENALKIASTMNDETRDKIVKNAIKGNLKNMRYILTDEQYRKYNRVLQVTLRNRNIKH